MGVNGLAKLFDRKKQQNCRGWKKQRIQGKLVVDGNQFCHQACSCAPFEFSYTKFYKYITEILQKFDNWGIEPYFIFDGVDKQSKLTSERRMRAVSNSRIPTLAYTVFTNVLSDKGVNMYVADGEGDVTAAEVANHFQCGVLSSDSDYFLFDIPGGYIDLKYCFAKKLFDFDSDIIEAEVYNREEFLRHHFPNNGNFIFLYPAIVGNGIHPATDHCIESGRPWSVEDVDRFIRQSPTITELHEKVQKNFEDVKMYYNSLNPLDPQEILSSPIPKCPKRVPDWFHISYRSREIPYMIFDALVNGTQHHGSSDISVRIRQCCYTIIGVHEVKEYRSNRRSRRQEPSEIPITRLNEIPGQFSLDGIASGAHDDRKKSVFYFALRCQDLAHELNALNEEDRFFMCTVVFWKSLEASPPDFVVKALLACFVRLSNPLERGEVLPPRREEGLSRFDSRNRPHFIDWQCVYQDALSLFLLLRYPRQDALCPSRIFDEKIVLSLASRGYAIDREIRRFIGDRNLQEKYEKLQQIVLRLRQ